MKTIFENWRQFHEKEDKYKSFYGSDFQYDVKEYTTDEGGLAQYGLSYSDYEKWGINPQGKYFPIGVWFYYLAGDCDSAIRGGFATDRKWANIAKINNDRMVIIKKGHPSHFDEEKLAQAVATLEKSHGVKYQEGEKKDAVPFAKLADFITNQIGTGTSAKFNKVLSEIGYDGIVDYDRDYLPIENCQGVITMPSGAKYVKSIPAPVKAEDETERLANMLQSLGDKENGSIKLTSDEIRKVIKMLPKFSHKWEVSETQSDFIGRLMQKLDFSSGDAWEWVEDREFGSRFYMELEYNPTTPKSYWEMLQHSSDEGARLTAKDMLAEL